MSQQPRLGELPADRGHGGDRVDRVAGAAGRHEPMERRTVAGDGISPPVAVDDHVEAVDQADEDELPPGDVREDGGDGGGAEAVDESEQAERPGGHEDRPRGAHGH